MMSKSVRAVAAAALLACTVTAWAGDFNPVPKKWKWISSSEAVFSYDGSFTDGDCFSVTVPSYAVTRGVSYPEKYSDFPVHPEGAVNLSYSPDSTKLAFTRDNDLYVVDIASRKETRLTFDGSDLVLNGYASWVYYEEILRRPSKYKAFWWSPDSKSIGFYRFDNSGVTMFPIFSPFGQDGSLSRTRYPKAGERNPSVRIGIVPADGGDVVWADFDEAEDQYFGIPFWGADSKEFFIAREPRRQNRLDLYAVKAADGGRKCIYSEEYPTWINWMDNVIFTSGGLYMVRAFETGWEQIYYLSYDGRTLKRLSDGHNWRTTLVRVDERTGEVFFTANRDSDVRAALYRLDPKGGIKALTDPAYAVSGVTFSPDGRYFVASLSNYATPDQIWIYETASADKAWNARRQLANARKGRRPSARYASSCFKAADVASEDADLSRYALPQDIRIDIDGLEVPGYAFYPKDFDPSRKYPVHVEIYGGPNTAYVRDRWIAPNDANQWWSEHGIIHMMLDCRASGHNGRAGTDLVFRDLTTVPVHDFCAWAEWLGSLPYVDASRIGVEGFSFGGTMTAMLLLDHSDLFCCGIAGGGVYDWRLYDTHYTERFMDTPEANPEGYRVACVLNHVPGAEDYASPADAVPYPTGVAGSDKVMLKLTHGTADDNVHYQNTLQLVDALQRSLRGFELMVYPDGMHGYRGVQGAYSLWTDHAFWTRYLLR